MDARARGRGRGRGRGRRGRGPVVESSSSASHRTGSEGEASGSASASAVGAGRGAGMAGRGAGPGLGAAPAQDRMDRMEGILTELLGRFPAVAPVQAPVVPPVAEEQQRAAGVEVRPSYLEMVSQMRQMSTAFFSGGVSPEEADEWRMRVERNFRSIRCPDEYRVELAIHYLGGDAHAWWRDVEARRPGAVWTWGEFVAEFNAKYFPQEALDRLASRFVDLVQGDRTVREYDAEFGRLLAYAGGIVDERTQVQRFLRGLQPELRTRCRVTEYASRAKLVEVAAGIEEDLRGQAAAVVPLSVVPPVQPRQQQSRSGSVSGSGKGGKPAQGQKRKWDGSSRASQASRGGACFGCGSLEHQLSRCPVKGEQQQQQQQQPSRQVDARVCYHCREPGHFRSACPRLQRMALAPVQPVAQLAAVQPLEQIGPAPRVYTTREVGQGQHSGGSITGNLGLRLLNSWL